MKSLHKIMTFLAMPIGMCLMDNYLSHLEQIRKIDIILDDDHISFEVKGGIA